MPYKRSPEENNKHNRLILALVNYLISKGYEISADHIGYPNGKPDEYGGKTPDIYAVKGNEQIFIEAETCDTLNTEDTREQWRILSSRKNTLFSVVVPRKCIKEAKLLAKKWGVPVEDFWTMNI